MAIKHNCDLCGAEIKTNEQMYIQLRNCYDELNSDVEICNSCLKEYVAWKQKMSEKKSKEGDNT